MTQLARRIHPAIEDVLPHGEGMRLLDAILDYGPDWVCARVTVAEDSFLYEPGLGVPAWVGVEYMAQTAAALGGIEDLRLGRKLSPGLLIGMREYRASVGHFAPGAALRVRASLVMRDERDFVAYDCAIELGRECIASAVLKAFRPADIHAMLAQVHDD